VDNGADIIVDNRFFLPPQLNQSPQFTDANPPEGAINQAINSVVSKGILYFSSAGNFKTGYPSIGDMPLPIYGHPNNENALTVGAVYYGRDVKSSFRNSVFNTQLGELEPYSSAGDPKLPFKKPDVVAPDGLPISFYPCDRSRESCDFNPARYKDGYYNIFGTSVSAPYTAALAALLKQKNPHASPVWIYDALRKTAQPLTGQTGFNLDSGYGLVRVDRANLYLQDRVSAPKRMDTLLESGKFQGS
jgi:subtilisin family serine protease